MLGDLNFLLFGCFLSVLVRDSHLLPPNVAMVRTSDQKRYYAYQNEELTWDEAKEFCQAENMKMAETVTYKKLNELRAFIRAKRLLPKDSNSGYWLGAKRQQGIWSWNTNTTKFSDNFMAGWHFAEPDNKGKYNGVTPDCLELQYRSGSPFTNSLSWNNLWCDERRGVVCEPSNTDPDEN